MCVLLLAGSQRVNAGTIAASHTIEKKHHVKFSNQDSNNSLIEEADLGFDEEHVGDDFNDEISKIYTGSYILSSDWYLTLFSHFIEKYHNNYKIFAPCYGQSNPIYITLQVLRIWYTTYIWLPSM